MFSLCGILASSAAATIPSANPPWAPVYDMQMSTLTMQCNGSGWSSPERGGQFGIVSYDWSNAKEQWAAAKPMDCEERLQTQAHMTKAANKNTHVFVYRNVVKALPWFTCVREKLDDPAYAGWFLRFSGKPPYAVPQCAPENASKCSPYYHDQEQTPAVATPTSPHPDGTCSASGCDSGMNPTGEYLFDHRNESLRQWILDELIDGKTGMGDPAISGFFIDDYWCSDLLCKESSNKVSGCPCGDPVQGATEIDKHQQADMGLSDEDIKALTIAWNETMAQVQTRILASGGYTWSLIPHQENANASPTTVQKSNCAAQLKGACSESSQWQSLPNLFGVHVNGTTLPQLKEDLAFFLLARGPYAWLGWGVWGMTWPFNPEPAHGELPPLPHGVPTPAEFGKDYGEPVGVCKETAPESGIFTREWTKSTVKLDCNKWEGTITMK